MSRKAQLANGTILEFPDGTPDNVMDHAVKSYHGTAAPAPAAPGKGWLERLTDTIGNAANTYARPVAAAYRGIQDQIPGIDHVAAVANEAGTALGLNHSTMNYSDRFNAFKNARQTQMQQDTHGNSTAAAAAHYVGEGVGLVGSGLAGAKVLQAAGFVNKAAKGANLVQRLAPTLKAGAVTGAAYGAGNASSLAQLPQNTIGGAVTGAVTGVAAHGLLKLAAGLSHPITDFLGTSKTADILRRYVGMTQEEAQAAYSKWQSRASVPGNTKTNPTLFEALPVEDQQHVQNMLGIMPGTSKAKAADMIAARVKNIAPGVLAKSEEVTGPVRSSIVDGMAQDLADSRSPGSKPTADDIALATKASRDPNMIAGNTMKAEKGGVPTVNSTINSNIMAPHDGTQIPAIDFAGQDSSRTSTVNDLVPQEPVQQKDGNIVMTETRPDISSMIRTAAGVQKSDPTGVTVGDLTSMISRLRGVANSSTDFVQSSTAKNAAEHLEGLLPSEAKAAFDRVSQSHQNYSQMKEGYQAGLDEIAQNNVNPTNDVRRVQNQYESPAGAQGRLLGHASALDQALSQGPSKSLPVVSDIAENPSTQGAITQNLDGVASPVPGQPAAGAAIGDAAQAQTESAQAFQKLNPQKPDQGPNLPQLTADLVRLHSFSPASKAQGAANFLRNLTRTGIPAEQAGQLSEMLFSQDPNKVAQGMNFLNSAGSAGKQALTDLQTTVGAAGAGSGFATQTPSTAPADPNDDGGFYGTDPATGGLVGSVTTSAQDPAAENPAAPVAQDPGVMVDPTKSPYMAKLDEIYNKTGSPALLDLANRVQRKESGDSHTNDDGTVKVSKAGAVGLMQIEPKYLDDFASSAGLPTDQVALHNDPAYNKLIGVHRLNDLLTHYNGDSKKAAAAYNAGSGRVDAAVANSPDQWTSALPKETQDYVADIQ